LPTDGTLAEMKLAEMISGESISRDLAQDPKYI
jgi:hypothetical protein